MNVRRILLLSLMHTLWLYITNISQSDQPPRLFLIQIILFFTDNNQKQFRPCFVSPNFSCPINIKQLRFSYQTFLVIFLMQNKSFPFLVISGDLSRAWLSIFWVSNVFFVQYLRFSLFHLVCLSLIDKHLFHAPMSLKSFYILTFQLIFFFI